MEDAYTLSISIYVSISCKNLGRMTKGTFAHEQQVQDVRVEADRERQRVDGQFNGLRTEVREVNSRVDREVHEVNSRVDGEVHKIKGRVDRQVEQVQSQVDGHSEEIAKVRRQADAALREQKRLNDQMSKELGQLRQQVDTQQAQMRNLAQPTIYYGGFHVHMPGNARTDQVQDLMTNLFTRLSMTRLRSVQPEIEEDADSDSELDERVVIHVPRHY